MIPKVKGEVKEKRKYREVEIGKISTIAVVYFLLQHIKQHSFSKEYYMIISLEYKNSVFENEAF